MAGKSLQRHTALLQGDGLGVWGRTELPCSVHGWGTVLIQQQAINKLIYQISNRSEK